MNGQILRAFLKAGAIFFLHLILVCPLSIKAKSNVSGSEDTLKSGVLHDVKHKSLVQSMNRQQLNSLIDFLMEMDTIPGDLAREIEIASARFRAEENKATNTAVSAASLIPASDLYASWEINNLFPEKDMLKLKGDTSVCLTLMGGKCGEYFHPFNGPVTSGFGWRDSTQHNGIDIDLNKGDKVSASFDGMVRIAKKSGGFGNVVIIRHYNGLETVYAHLSKIKVKPGQVVVAGQIIGLGGSTGHSTGSHLHFEVRFKGVPINPKYLISFPDQKLLCNELIIKKSKWGLAAYPKDSHFYVIEKGDTIFEIAKRFGTTTASIKEINGFTGGRIRLKVGQQITVMR
ncbi:MAG: LysM peptidoglycan-binding protein [Bacteroidetes bacterium]|jgi:murein DD-endopeptidase MepM/ murein hydrolase activator NlpD|nr:LysM peptidoglycan-binding protein [Bacteroidota bacterium]